MLKFKNAVLNYGLRSLPVNGDVEQLIGDFDHGKSLDDIAFHAMAVLSHASGGYPLKDGTLHIHRDFAMLIGNGFTVRWGESTFKFDSSISMEDNIKEHDRVTRDVTIYKVPFAVKSPHLGDGWKRAIKIPR